MRGNQGRGGRGGRGGGRCLALRTGLADLLGSKVRPGQPGICLPRGRAGEGADSVQGALWGQVEPAALLLGHPFGAGTARPEGHQPP